MKNRRLFIILLVMFLLGASSASLAGASRWKEIRSSLPTSSAITGMYMTGEVNPARDLDTQEMLIYNPVEKKVCGYFPDGNYAGGEWGNAMFCYDPAADNGTTTTGWSLMWDSLVTQLNGQASVRGPEITGLSCSNGVVIVSALSNSALFLRIKGVTDSRLDAYTTWLLPQYMPTGLTSGKMFHISGVGGVTGPYRNLYTTFSYDDAHCIDGSYKPTSETIIIDPDEYPDRPMRRHAEGMTFDTKRNAIWLATGVGDANTDATSINGAHSGFADLYEMTKSTQWAWSQICGFGGANVGTGVPSIGPGPGSLCGEETLTPETTSPAVAGIPCLDTGPKMGGAFGGVSADGNNSSCGYKFPYAGFDPTNDAVVIFGGQFNSGVTCETVLYYPATNTWLNPYDPAKCGAGNVPPANWNQAGSRLVPIGDGRLLLFGGLNGNVPLSETWIFKTCTANNKSACGWEKVMSSVNPAADPTPVIDWDSARGVVVYIDKQAPAHTWFFNPITLQWSDENKLSSEYAGGPSLTRAMNNGKTQPYFSIGAYDALTNQMVVFNTCDATSTPACSHTGTQTWILDLP